MKALSVLVALALLGCKREVDPEPHARSPAPAASLDARVAADTVWYRAGIRAADGIEARFFLGVPAPGTPGQAIIKVGGHEVRSEASFDGKTLRIPLTVHQTAIEATASQDGLLAGSFSTSWRAWGASSIPLTGTRVDAPTTRALATVSVDGEAIDLGEPRSVWKIAMQESGIAKLVIRQTAPGELEGIMFLDTGNINYLAGNGRGDTIVLSGFDGTAGYRLELTLDRDRTRARGRFYAGHRFDWRETFTATRGAEFALAIKPQATRPGSKIVLPDLPELAALPPGPLVVELAGSWCSTCRDAAPFLVEIYREYHPRGLQMVTLLYELTDDPAIDAKQAATFKTTYGVTWPVVPVPGNLDDFAEIVPRGLVDANPAGFPITLFLAPDRTLVALHAGFPGVATEEHGHVVAELRANLESLLAGHQPVK